MKIDADGIKTLKTWIEDHAVPADYRGEGWGMSVKTSELFKQIDQLIEHDGTGKKPVVSVAVVLEELNEYLLSELESAEEHRVVCAGWDMEEYIHLRARVTQIMETQDKIAYLRKKYSGNG